MMRTSDMFSCSAWGNATRRGARAARTQASAGGLPFSQVPKIEKALERPSCRELLDAIRSQPELELNPSPAEILRQERESR